MRIKVSKEHPVLLRLSYRIFANPMTSLVPIHAAFSWAAIRRGGAAVGISDVHAVFGGGDVSGALLPRRAM